MGLSWVLAGRFAVAVGGKKPGKGSDEELARRRQLGRPVINS